MKSKRARTSKEKDSINAALADRHCQRYCEWFGNAGYRHCGLHYSSDVIGSTPYLHLSFFIFSFEFENVTCLWGWWMCWSMLFLFILLGGCGSHELELSYAKSLWGRLPHLLHRSSHSSRLVTYKAISGSFHSFLRFDFPRMISINLRWLLYAFIYHCKQLLCLKNIVTHYILHLKALTGYRGPWYCNSQRVKFPILWYAIWYWIYLLICWFSRCSTKNSSSLIRSQIESIFNQKISSLTNFSIQGTKMKIS